MKVSLLKKFDSILCPPCCILGQALGTLFHDRTSSDRPLIVRPGGLGDLIVLCISLEELGLDPRNFHWMIEKRSKDWADHLSLDYSCYDANSFANLWKLAGRFSIVINSEQHFGLSQAAAVVALARQGKTFTFSTNRAAGWASKTVPYDPLNTHETIEFGHLLIQALGLKNPAPQIISRRRKTPPTAKPVVGIGGLQADSRSLSEDRWFRLILDWAGDRKFQIASSPADAPFARRLAERFQTRAEAIRLPFSDLCRVIEAAEEVFTMDSGFMHVASYYGVPVTALFTSGRYKKWLPLSAGSALVKRSDLTCQPCALFGQVPPCPYQYACKELDFSTHKINIRRGTL